jgi:glucose/mannose transport system permease protein
VEAASDQGVTIGSRRLPRGFSAGAALLPAAVIFVVVYVGCSMWSVYMSFTSSRMLPNNNFVGLAQYRVLFENDRWSASVWNLAVFGPLFVGGSLVLGILMAIAIDQRIKGENLWRTLFLYSYAVSFIVTGLLWRWMLDPRVGVQRVIRDMGFSEFTFDWTVNQDRVIFTLVIAAIWHAAGLVMALTLAGLRGIDRDIWNAIRVDGIPFWRGYIQIILPMMSATIFTAFILLSIAVIKVYDLVVAMTNGGPGFASEMPAKFVMDYLFDRGNVGLATAATTIMLIGVIIFLAPWYVMQRRQKSRKQA